jgi:hypothetical protein
MSISHETSVGLRPPKVRVEERKQRLVVDLGMTRRGRPGGGDDPVRRRRTMTVTGEKQPKA